MTDRCGGERSRRLGVGRGRGVGMPYDSAIAETEIDLEPLFSVSSRFNFGKSGIEQLGQPLQRIVVRRRAEQELERGCFGSQHPAPSAAVRGVGCAPCLRVNAYSSASIGMCSVVCNHSGLKVTANRFASSGLAAKAYRNAFSSNVILSPRAGV